GYFKLHYNAKTKMNSSKKSFGEGDDSVSKTLGVNMQGNLTDADSLEEGASFTGESSFEFTVSEVPATMSVYWYGAGSNTRDVYVLDSDGKEVTGLYEKTDGSSTNIVSEFIIKTAGTYYLGCKTGGCVFCYIEVREGYEPSGDDDEEEIDRGNWEDVLPPTIEDITMDTDKGTFTINAKGVVNAKGEGADSITLEVYNAEHFELLDNPQPIDSIVETTTTKTAEDHITKFTYTPSGSGSYKFRVVLSREDILDDDDVVIAEYEDKASEYSDKYEFNLKLKEPSISTLMNLDEDEDGKGGITATWGAVAEADYYILSAMDSNDKKHESKTEGTSADIAGLTIGDTVKVKVTAYREKAGADSDTSESAEMSIEITGVKPTAYLFDGEDYADDASSNGVAQSAGTKFGTNDYYTLMIDSTVDSGKATALLRTQSTGTFIQNYQIEGSGLKFEVYGTADASFNVASTGSSNWSAYALVDENGHKITTGQITGTSVDGEYTGEDAGVYATCGTTISTIDYKGLEPGVYTFFSPAVKNERHVAADGKGENSRGGRIHKVIVYDTGSMPYRGDWNGENIGTPIISKITYVKGESNINVTASGYIGYYGADSLMIEMLDSKGNVVDSDIKAADSEVDDDGNRTSDSDLDFAFKPKASGDYSFRASLIRSGEDNITMAEDASDWEVKDFVLPLATPAVNSMTNVEYTGAEEGDLGSLEIVYKAVDEADYYVIAAFSENSLLKNYYDIEAEESDSKIASIKDEGKNDYTVVLEGLPKAGCYVTVQAFRDTSKEELNLDATTTTITRVVAGDGTVSVIPDVVETQTTAESSKAITPTEDGFATALVRSNPYSPTNSKYVNGKNDTRWSYAKFGSNTSKAAYSRPSGLTDFDGETNPASIGSSTPANGYYEEVYDENNVPDGMTPGDLKSVTIWSENGRGKVVPASTDGLSYYYTTIDPSVNNNFTLSALIHVKSWQYSNGQDGFGMMVSDTVGNDDDDSDFWTNSYQLLASKIQYSWRCATGTFGEPDYVPGAVTDAPGNGNTVMRYEMKLGVGWNSKEGATASDLAKISAGNATAPANFSTNSGTLETSAGNRDNGQGLETGTYNVIGNGYNTTAIPTSSVASRRELLTDFRFQIQKYDNAYVLRYLAKDPSGDVTAKLEALQEEDEEAYNKAIEDNKPYVTIDGTKYHEINGKYYEVLGDQAFSDDNNNKLTQIDKNNIYVGFFAARYARIGVYEIDLDLDPADSGDYEVPTTYVDPSITISSMESSNNENYDLTVSANFDGTLTVYKQVYDSNTKTWGTQKAVTTGKEITSGTKCTFTTKLDEGITKFICYAKPNDSYVPGENQKLSTYDMLDNSIEVTYHAFNGTEIYVAPNGAEIGTTYTSESDETTTIYAGQDADHPTNVYDAVDYAKAGQTIILAGGHYYLKDDPTYGQNGKAKNLLIGRNHDGTAKSYITMKAADDAVDNGATYNRPILDFGQNTQLNDTAFSIAGNYWKFEGFDVMGSQDGEKGILLGGSHNILSDLRTYLNGNTGVQIARYGSGGRSEWPSYNTVINCSSFLNYDAGYEDADGFAAKLTCGDGNQFIGCISAYNADDGWDLFAKVESGSIGVVTIDRCLAFMNGYLFGIEDYYGSGSDLIYRYVGKDFSKYTKNTTIVDAGNGNGFKMGGDSMSGYHVLKNSIAFGNKSKGIDSNSCPDIQIYNTISFNNEANNVALYTGAAVNTDYYVENLISVKDSSCRSNNGGMSTVENISPKGTQNVNKIYGSDNYFWNGSRSLNVNGDEYNTSVFGHMSMNNAIFGGSIADKISRDADGSINLNGFLVPNDDSWIGGSKYDDAIDEGAYIYVFAADYSKGNSKLADIKLSGHESTTALAADGYDWVDGDILISSYAGTAVDFKVKKTDKETGKTSERTVTVNFIQLDGAELQVTGGDENNDGILDASETWTVEAVPVISPAVEPDYTLNGFKAEITETSKELLKLGTPAVGTVNANLNVTGAKVTVNGKGTNGSAKMTATVSLTVGNKTVKKTAVLAFTVKDKTGIKFDTIDPTPGADSDQVRWTADSDYIQVAMNTMTNKTFTLKNLHFTELNSDDEEVVKDFGKGVTIKVNDASVIKLKSTASSTNGVDATFTVVNKSGDGGTATITVTSKNDKSLVRNYIVTVSGSEFAWSAGTVTIDKAKTAGIQLTAIAPFDQSMSNVVDNDITVAAVYKGTKATGKTVAYNDYFEAAYKVGSVYELNTKESAVKSLPKGTYTVVYQAKVKVTEEADGDSEQTGEPTVKTEQIKFTPITIKVIETKPVVTFRQTKKVNLFYNNGTDGSTGKLTATSKLGAVTLEPVENSYFRISNNGAGYDIVSINKKPIDELKSNGSADFRTAKRNNKLTLTAHVEGYWPAYDPKPRTFTIGVEYRQPKLKVTVLDKTIYTQIGMDSADILIYDPSLEMYLGADYVTLETNAANKKAYSKANNEFTVGDITSGANSGNGVRLSVNKDTKTGGAVRLSVKYSDWYSDDAVIITQSIKVNTKTTPKLTIKPVKLNINTLKFVGKEQAAASVLLTGASGYTIDEESFKLTSSNAKATEFLKFVDYELSTDVNGNQVLLVSLKDEADDGTAFPAEEKNGTGVYKMKSGYASGYSYKVEYKLGTSDRVQTAAFKISLVSNEKLTVAVKGSINIIDRDNSTVTLKPKTTNFTPSQVSSVALMGDAANLFTITDFDRSTGAMTVKAKDTAILKKGSYKVTPVYYFDLGVSGTARMTTLRPVVIKTTQSNLKISGLKDALEVKLSSTDMAAQRTITVAPAGAEIIDMTQTSLLDNFTLTYTGDGVEVAIKNRAGLKEGKTYKITALITVEGSGTNVKKQQISIPVKVIR
ncbi:MAG: hypothetical protein HDR03_14120, partial [Lachnospiraceae bacterium]|nr:hypothetical protein [Lachnospiraceae bacterium]